MFKMLKICALIILIAISAHGLSYPYWYYGTTTDNNNSRDDAMFIRTVWEDQDFAFQIGRLATARSYHQRVEIALEYERLYSVNFVKDLEHSKLKGETRKLMQGLFSYLPDYYAVEINRAVIGMGTDEMALNDVLCCLNDITVDDIRYEYRRRFGSSMDVDILDDVSGEYEILLGDIIALRRLTWPHEDEIVDLITKDFTDATLGTVPDSWFFSRSDYQTIKKASDQFELSDNNGINLSTYFSIKVLYRDDLTEMLRSIASFAEDPAKYYAERLWQALEEGDNARLTRIIVSQAYSQENLEKLNSALEVLADVREVTSWIMQGNPGQGDPFHRYLLQNLLQGNVIETQEYMGSIKFTPQSHPTFIHTREYFRSFLGDLVVFE